jgi:hypothetical protein
MSGYEAAWLVSQASQPRSALRPHAVISKLAISLMFALRRLTIIIVDRIVRRLAAETLSCHYIYDSVL